MTKMIKHIPGDEIKIHGSRWNSFHSGYFSDISISRYLVSQILKSIELSSPDIIVDLGGGTGFILEKLIEAGVARTIDLCNYDTSKAQLDMVQNARISLIEGELLNLKRDVICGEEKHFLFIMRSVLHYFGKEGLPIILQHLRSQAREGEFFVHQTAVFENSNESRCMNYLYKLMGTDKWYPTYSELEKMLKKTGWSIYSISSCPSLHLSSIDLSDRYNINQKEIHEIKDKIFTSFNDPGKSINLTTDGFNAYLPYKVYICCAI